VGSGHVVHMSAFWEMRLSLVARPGGLRTIISPWGIATDNT
jgi:hypothetical protein